MAKKKWAFMMMGEQYNPIQHNRKIETDVGTCDIICVTNFEQAKEYAIKLADEGCGALELCGAFGEKLAEEIVQAVEHRMAVGYVTASEEELPKLGNFFCSLMG